MSRSTKTSFAASWRSSEGDLYQLSRITETQRRLYSLELFQFVNVTPRLPEDRSPQVPDRRDGDRRQAPAAAARGRLRFRGESARPHQLAACELLRRRAHRRGRSEGVVARAGRARQLPRALSVSTRTVPAALGIDLVGGRARLRAPQQRRPSHAGEGFQPCEGGQRAVASATPSAPRSYRSTRTTRSRPAFSTTRRFATSSLRWASIPMTGRGKGTVVGVRSSISSAIRRQQPLDPRQGYVVSGHVQKAGQWLRGTFDFTELYGEVRGYVPIGSRFVWANRAGLGDAGRAERGADSVLQALLCRRFEQRSRMGTLPGEPADARRGADWRAHDAGGFDRGAVRHSRQAGRSAVRRRRQRVGRPVGSRGSASCAGPSVQASATTRQSGRCVSTSASN